MKTVIRLIVVAWLIVLVLPLVPVGAQGEGLLPAPGITAVFYQSATSGSFVDNGNGSYTLTLEGVGVEVIWLISSPSLQVYRVDAATLVADWAAAPESLSTSAVLETADLNIQMTLSSPVYDAVAGTQTYQATVSQVMAIVESKDEPALPETFDSANLSIAWGLEFQDGLVAGIEKRYEGMRATPEQCTAAKQAYTDYMAWLAPLNAEYAANSAQIAAGTGDTAALQARNTQIAAMTGAKAAEMGPTMRLMFRECK
jgi:hypothetical protein